MKKYRIEEENGLFFPQKKGILYGWDYFMRYSGIHNIPIRLRFNTCLKASQFIRENEAEKEVIKPKKTYYYSF